MKSSQTWRTCCRAITDELIPASDLARRARDGPLTIRQVVGLVAIPHCDHPAHDRRSPLPPREGEPPAAGSRWRLRRPTALPSMRVTEYASPQSSQLRPRIFGNILRDELNGFPVEAFAIQMSGSPTDTSRPFPCIRSAKFLHGGTDVRKRKRAVRIMEQRISGVRYNAGIEGRWRRIVGYPHAVIDSPSPGAALCDTPDQGPVPG